MTSLIKGRQLQLWEYHVSHGSLLLRSPEGVGHRGTVDIICTGVQYVAVPRHAGEIEVAGATVEEIAKVEKILGKKIQLPEQVCVLENSRAIPAGGAEFAYSGAPRECVQEPAVLTGSRPLRHQINCASESRRGGWSGSCTRSR